VLRALHPAVFHQITSWVLILHLSRVAVGLHDRHEWTTLFIASRDGRRVTLAASFAPRAVVESCHWRGVNDLVGHAVGRHAECESDPIGNSGDWHRGPRGLKGGLTPRLIGILTLVFTQSGIAPSKKQGVGVLFGHCEKHPVAGQRYRRGEVGRGFPSPDFPSWAAANFLECLAPPPVTHLAAYHDSLFSFLCQA